MSKNLADVIGAEACCDCQYAYTYESNDMLFYCRRRAPVVMRGERGVWPVVRGDECCGEFKKSKDD
jgi:hypothetical protein